MDHEFKLTQWDLVTYPGIAAAVIVLVLGLRKLFPRFVEKKEPFLALFLTYALGIASKVSIKGAFANVQWLVFLLTLFAVAVFAKTSYDHLKDVVLGFFGQSAAAGLGQDGPGGVGMKGGSDQHPPTG
jgi:hypothetical protein